MVMELIRYLRLLYFSLLISGSQSELQIMDLSNFHQKEKPMLMERCIFEKLIPAIVSHDLQDIIYEITGIEGFISTFSIDPTFEITKKTTMFLSKLPIYVLSTSKLQTVLQKLKSSSWWNINSRFLVLELSKKCNNAWDILQIMWKMNLLSSLLMCRNDEDSVDLYTYNPYANYAPYPWQHLSSTLNERLQNWSLFKRYSSSVRYGCNNLFFDKTKYLNGSNIIAGAIAHPKASVKFGKAYTVSSIRNKISLTVSQLFKEIFSTLHVTPIIYYRDLDNPQNLTNQTINGLIDNLADGTYDMALNYFTIIGYSDSIDLLYPRQPSTHIILTRHSEVLSSLEQLGFVFGIDTLVLTFSIFLITLIVLLLCKRPRFGSALLEILRLILSTSTLLKFYRHSLRIFLLSVLIFVMFMNNIYQGQMSAYSTKSNREVINSIADLQNLKYKIYVLSYTSRALGVNNWSDEQKKYVHTVDNDCSKYVINSTDFRTACIFVARVGLSVAIKYDLHVALINDLHFNSQLIRNDWPLKIQFDLIMSRLSEAGFLRLWDSIAINDPLKKIQLKETIKFSGYREVVMEDLYNIFIFLMVSLAISFVVFIFEICKPPKILNKNIKLRAY